MTTSPGTHVGQGLEAGRRLEPVGAGRQVAAGGGHGRPARVAVISWLRPPDSACRFTVENPASTSMVRRTSGAGR